MSESKAFHSAPKAKRRSGEDGSAVLVVALMLSVLILIFAFVVRTGYSVAQKHRFQAGLDAAALAGARFLCGDDPIARTRAVAVENGLPDSDDMTVQLGFYDELGLYPDFSEFTDFEPDPVPETPYVNEGVAKISDGDSHYNNAIMVSVDTTERDPSGGLGGGGVRTRDYAVAYAVRYGIVAGDGGMTVEGRFYKQYPLFKDMAIVSEGDLVFFGTERFSGDVRVVADGQVVNCPVPFSAVTAPVERPTLDQDLERLKAEAAAAGTLIDASAEWVADGNWYSALFGAYLRNAGTSAIRLTDGDHHGAVYFIQGESDNGMSDPVTRITVEEAASGDMGTAWNFTLATDVEALNFVLARPLFGTSITLGGPGEKNIFVYAKETIRFFPRYASGFSSNYVFAGAFLRCREFQQEIFRRGSEETRAQRMRIVADKITCLGKQYANPLYEGIFGPPCPAWEVRLGSLVPISE